MTSFPVPIGGNVTDDDRIPCLIFISLHSILLVAIVWNQFIRRQWSLVYVGTVIFAVERVVAYALRYRQAANIVPRTDFGLLQYQQGTLGLGYIGFGGDIMNCYKSLLVQTTLPDDEAGYPNLVDKRKKYRGWMTLASLSFIGAVVPGAVTIAKWRTATVNQADADEVQRLRLISAVLALILIQHSLGWVIWGYFRVERIAKRPCLYIIALLLAIDVVAIYRIATIFDKETSLTEVGPGSTTSAKVLFYLFQSGFELILTAGTLVAPTRRLYGTGRWGDPGNDILLNKKLAAKSQQNPSGEELVNRPAQTPTQT